VVSAAWGRVRAAPRNRVRLLLDRCAAQVAAREATVTSPLHKSSVARWLAWLFRWGGGTLGWDPKIGTAWLAADASTAGVAMHVLLRSTE
jgi:hypothetical protein